MKDDILKRLVTWATGVNTLNGTYTLSRDQYQELRAMQKDAMEALKPEPPKMEGPSVSGVASVLGQERAAEVYRKLFPAQRAVVDDNWKYSENCYCFRCTKERFGE